MSQTQTTDYLLTTHALPTVGSNPPYAAGIELRCEEEPTLSEYQWPTHAAVPWPRGTVRGRYFRLGIFEDGTEIPSQEVDAQTWDRHGVDLRWSHLHFVWKKGKSYAVKGVSRATPVPMPAHPISVIHDDNVHTITVETGTIKATINKQAFALLNEILLAPSRDGAYTTQILSGSSGPEISESAITLATRYDALLDPSGAPLLTAKVEVEGPLYVVIKAEGVYRADPASPPTLPWAGFTTRIHFWADQDWIRVVHNLGYREDMSAHEYDSAAIHMPFNCAERYAFVASDTTVLKDDLGATDFYFHQERHDRYRCGTDAELTANTPRVVGTRSNNEWAIQGAAKRTRVESYLRNGWPNGWAIQGAAKQARVECYLRNGWQEFPFEAKVSPTDLALSMQPWHGYEAFGVALTDGGHTGEGNIHKLRYAHTGPKQRQGLPAAYVNAFNTMDPNRYETFETNANDAASSNWQGMMLRQDFYLRITRDPATSITDFDTSGMIGYANLVQSRPIAVPKPSHISDSFVFGPMATVEDGYAEIFDYVTDIIKGDYNAERGEYYGRFRWGALPHHWQIAKNRPEWHRLEYGDSHYDRIALNFWYYMATGDTELLQIARKAVKFHQCFRYVNYAPGPPQTIQGVNHELMFQWHKGLTPCAGVSGDDPSGRTGHWVHAYSMLVGWLVDADLDLRDAYQRWSENASHQTGNRERNVNNNVHEAIQQYEYFHERKMKAPIKAMTVALTAEPMSTFVGSSRDWDKAWPLYLDLFGGKNVRCFLESEAAPGHWLYTQQSGFAHMALCYRITGDKTFLERALKPLRSYVLRQIFRTNADPYRPAFLNNVYDQPEIHKTLLHFLCYLKQAGITAIPEDDGEPGQYPTGGVTIGDFDEVKDRGLWVAIYNPDGRSFTLQLRHLDDVGVRLYDPNGTEVLRTTILQNDPCGGVEQMRASGWTEFKRHVTIPAGPAGRYDLYMGSFVSGQFLPTTTEGLLECGVIRNNSSSVREYRAWLTRMYLLPLTEEEIEWNFAAISTQTQNWCRIRIYDKVGHLIVDKYSNVNIPGVPADKEFNIRMNGPGDPLTPWRIDCGPGYRLTASIVDTPATQGLHNLALIGPNRDDLELMKQYVPTA